MPKSYTFLLEFITIKSSANIMGTDEVFREGRMPPPLRS
jgi:hypothetical protein